MKKDLEMLRELSLAEQPIAPLWRTVADLELAPLGLTHPRWTALWKLSRLGGHLSQKTLAEALEIELPSLMRTWVSWKSRPDRAPLLQPGQARPHRHPDPAGKALLKIEDRIMPIRRAAHRHQPAGAGPV
jgi:MarR family transcriptional regulator for hemolysin